MEGGGGGGGGEEQVRHSPEPRKCLCKLFIQLTHTLLMIYIYLLYFANGHT